MAGIGVQLNKIFDKHTLTSSLYGIGFSIVYTIMPMIIIITTLLLMYKVLGFNTVSYIDREVFSSTVLYIFIFSLLTSSPFNSVLSKFQTDKIYERRYEDIRPCIYVGVIINLTFSSLVAIPFYIYAIFVGKISVYYVFTSYMAYLGLTLALSAMLYNSILKQYKKISLYFFVSMVISLCLSMIFKFLLHFTIAYSMLLALALGFLLIAALELSNVLRYFPDNSNRYKDVLAYYKKYWTLIASNFLYTFGLFIHNFVFWTVPWRLVIHNTYVTNEAYDMTTFLAMFSSISSSIFFISRVEMSFHERYKDYIQATIDGKLKTIMTYQKRMLEGLASQILSLAYLQFMVSVIIFFFATIILPRFGFSGLVMDIYPQLAVGYYISYLMYAELLFLYYFDDLVGALVNGVIFCGVTLIGTIISSKLTPPWYGAGFTFGALMAFTYSYFRIRWISKNINKLIFCRGSIIKSIYDEMPNSLVYNKK